MLFHNISCSDGSKSGHPLKERRGCSVGIHTYGNLLTVLFHHFAEERKIGHSHSAKNHAANTEIQILSDPFFIADSSAHLHEETSLFHDGFYCISSGSVELYGQQSLSFTARGKNKYC